MRVCKFLGILLLGFSLISTSGCAVVKATDQPDKKNVAVLNKGTQRNRVIAELGQPVKTEVTEDGQVDVFTFVQGYSKGTKAARAFGHGLADIYTLGLWELAGTPIESSANGTEVQVEVHYDRDNRVAKTVVFSGGKVLKGVTSKHS